MELEVFDDLKILRTVDLLTSLLAKESLRSLARRLYSWCVHTWTITEVEADNM